MFSRHLFKSNSTNHSLTLFGWEINLIDWESVKSSKALIDYTRLTIYQGFK